MTYRKGFTLIELLVVIFIIGLLASIIIVAVSSARAKGRDSRRVADIKSVQTALEMYNDTNGSYPVQTTAVYSCTLCDGTDPNTGWIPATTATTPLYPNIISILPLDPQNNAKNRRYGYRTDANGNYKVAVMGFETGDYTARYAANDGGTAANHAAVIYELFSSLGATTGAAIGLENH